MIPLTRCCLLLAGACAAAVVAQALATELPREHLSIDLNWRFHLGDDWPGAPRLDQIGVSTGPVADRLNDDSWLSMNLPHEWAIELPLKENGTAICRAHVKLIQEELESPGIQIRFGTIDDDGWIYVNNQRVGELHDWNNQPVFDIKKHLLAGDNLVAMGVKNDGGAGGMNPEANLEIVGKPEAMPWARTLFKGFAQFIVQSTRDASGFKPTARSDGLKAVTAVVRTQACTPRPAVP